MFKPARFAIPALTLFSLILSSCYLPERHIPGFSVLLYSPSAGAILSVGAAHAVNFLAFSGPGQPVTEATVYASGRVIGTASLVAESGGQYRGTLDWTPTSVGEYFLNVVASRGSGPEVTSAPVRVCVMDAALASAIGTPSYGFTGPCDIPAVHASAVPARRLAYVLGVLPDTLQYNVDLLPPGLAEADCPIVPRPRITFTVDMTDASDQVVLVSATYSVTGVAGGREPGATRSETLVLSRAGGDFPRKLWSGQSSDVEAMLEWAFGNGNGSLAYDVKMLRRDGGIEAEEGGTLPVVTTCRAAPPTPTAVPSPTAVAERNRCDAFAGMDIKLVTLEWQTDRPLTFYLSMPGGVPGLERPVSGDTDPWNYSVKFGAFTTEACELISGYPGRLYCDIRISPEFENTMQTLELSLNGCEQPVYKMPRADIPDYPGPAEATEEPDCSEFGDLNACSAAGCSWDFNANTCS